MKITVYTIVLSTYDGGDNYLHQESHVFTNKKKAVKKFNSLKRDIKENEMCETGYSFPCAIDEQECEYKYAALKETGTEFEYQVKLELLKNELEFNDKTV